MKYTADRSLVLEAFEIGPSQSLTPEGYLLCKGVPIARVGVQQYLNAELEPDAEGGPDGVIHVERRPEEVFHPDTIASFEGKPVTIDHPPEMLNPDNVDDHKKGTMLNVRRGDVGMTDYLIADLLIMNRDAINDVRSRKLRQVSCGYGSDYMSLAPGRARQHNIIGNHVAMLAGRGRCGPTCAIGDEDMVNKKAEEKKPSLFRRFLEFMDAEGAFKEGEEGALSFDESLPSKSGGEAVSMGSGQGGDIHIHVGAGPDGSTSIAPTTDSKTKDKKTKDKKKSKDDEGAAEEMEESETMDDEPDEDKKGFMDAMSKAYDAEMKKVRDKKGTKDKKAKDSEKEDEEKETKDKDPTANEGEEESEGSVENADEDKEDDEEKETKDKKPAKDKKATKDSAPLKTDFTKLKSDVEILAPGLQLPTFDSAQPQKATMDSMCLLRRRALAASNATDEGKDVLTMLNGGKSLDLKTLTCDTAVPFFNSAVAFARDRNGVVSGLKKAKATTDARAPTSPADFNTRTAAFYESKKPQPKSA